MSGFCHGCGKDIVLGFEQVVFCHDCASKQVEAASSASTNIPMQAVAQIAACAERLENCGDDWYAVVQDVASELRQLLHG